MGSGPKESMSCRTQVNFQTFLLLSLCPSFLPSDPPPGHWGLKSTVRSQRPQSPLLSWTIRIPISCGLSRVRVAIDRLTITRLCQSSSCGRRRGRRRGGKQAGWWNWSRGSREENAGKLHGRGKCFSGRFERAVRIWRQSQGVRARTHENLYYGHIGISARYGFTWLFCLFLVFFKIKIMKIIVSFQPWSQW